MITEKDLARRIVEVLKENNVRKDVRATKMTLHITDDEGNAKDFVVKKPRTDVLFDTADVRSIIEAFMAVVSDAILHGEEVRMFNFGTFRIKQKAASKARHPETKELIDVPAYYYPSFTYAKRLKNAAKLYEATEQESSEFSSELMEEIYNAIDNGDFDEEEE